MIVKFATTKKMKSFYDTIIISKSYLFLAAGNKKANHYASDRLFG
jgi:hypothetical protein